MKICLCRRHSRNESNCFPHIQQQCEIKLLQHGATRQGMHYCIAEATELIMFSVFLVHCYCGRFLNLFSQHSVADRNRPVLLRSLCWSSLFCCIVLQGQAVKQLQLSTAGENALTKFVSTMLSLPISSRKSLIVRATWLDLPLGSSTKRNSPMSLLWREVSVLVMELSNRQELHMPSFIFSSTLSLHRALRVWPCWYKNGLLPPFPLVWGF